MTSTKSKYERNWISNEKFFSDEPILGELWIDIDAYKGVELSSIYQVSNMGRIRRIGGHVLKGSNSSDGYHEIQLSIKGGRGKSLYVRAHILILTTFNGYPPDDMSNPTVQHINHDKLDNRIENLCWMTAFDNNQERHGRRIKIIDSAGEHIFNSQKVASKYIGRYEDYIAECINNGYKITDKLNKKIEVYAEIDNQWIKHEQSVSTHRNRCKLHINNSIYEFESFHECDAFLHKPIGHVSSMIHSKFPICDNPDVEFYTYDINLSQYVKYIPSKIRRKQFAIPCKLTWPSNKCMVFSSMTKAANFLEIDPENFRLRVKDNKPVTDKYGNILSVEQL